MRTTRTSGSRSSDGQEQDSFARAVDSGIRDVSDRTLQRDLTVVAALRQVGAAVGPTTAERDRMRQRVLAEFSSVVHEGNSPVLPLRTSRRSRWLPDETRGRVVVAAAAALCVVMSLSGMSVLLSRDAVPGDALYTFKRTAESAELGLTFGDQPKALKHLEFAGDRVNEIEIMANQADSAGNWAAGQGKFVRALDDFDSDTTAGARLLTGLALHGQPSSLPALRAWAQQQKARLAVLRAALPTPISARLDSTLALLDRVVGRASTLSDRSGCVTITSGVRDELGLLPSKDACKPVPVDGTSAAVPLPSVPALPALSPPSAIVPPNLLLRPPSVNAVPVPTQNGSSSQSGLPTTRGPGGVLPNPAQPGSERLRPEPWRPFPAQDSPKPAAPLPPWILQPRLLPPG
ncbi:MAG: DUF5667 domain-containing protein [Actinomycetota bacterium]|nr:DUF5667 domain-containing protein [Actinomycetota bacterium]